MATQGSIKRHLGITSTTYVSTSDVTIGGNLTVDGTTVTLNTATLDVEDKNILVNKGGTKASADGAGLSIFRGSSSTQTLTWSDSNSRFEFSHPLKITGSLNISDGSITTDANQLQVNTPGGYGQFGAMNIHHLHIYTDRPSIYTNKPILIMGNTALTTSDTIATDKLPSGVFQTRSATVGTESDWDVFTEQGTYGVASGAGAQFTGNNAPDADYRYGHLVVTEDDGQGIRQTYYPHSGKKIFTRTGWGNASWYSGGWHEHWTSLNHPTTISGYGITDSFAPSDAEKNVQANWNETSSSSDAFIQNKPSIPSAFNGGDVANPVVVANRSATSILQYAQSGNWTGAVKITMPGTHSSNWSMIVLRITVYEYNGNTHTMFTVSGHDWTSGWYNNGVKKWGDSNKNIGLGYTSTEDCIIIGEVDSTWSYGHITVDVISHPGFYSNNMDISTANWKIEKVTSLEGITRQAVANRQVWDSSDFSNNSTNWDSAYTYSQVGHLPLTGGTLTNQTTISVNAADKPALNIRNTSNGGGAIINFSDVNANPTTQHGTIDFRHSDTASYGSGAAFIFGTDQSLTVLADGKLMYKDGIYSKPSSGTGAGTRKDANWDTAYGWGNHKDQNYLTSLPSHNHDDRYYTETEVTDKLAAKTDLNNIRSLGNRAFTGGSDTTISTADFISEMDSDGAFNSYSSVFKTSWSYAGNKNLSDAGRFTETAGTSFITWTDNSSDVRGNITVLAVCPNTGGSSNKVFIYNDQGSSYAPGWREIWTSASDGSGSGLDADKVDGIHASSLIRSDAADTFTGTLTMGTRVALVANNYGHGVFGLYNSERYQHVWSMGAAYKLPDDGTTGGNLYGIAYSHTNMGGETKAGLDHQALFMLNGVTKTAIGTGIWTEGLITTKSYGTSANWNTAYGWGNHASAGYVNQAAVNASHVDQAKGLSEQGFGTDELTFYQTSSGYANFSGGWAHYIISNHGNGQTYYNVTDIRPFWGVPQYSRQEGTEGVWKGPFSYWTEENFTPGNFSVKSGNETISGSKSFSNSYNEFGNAVGSVSNNGSWQGRVNIAGTQHARLDVQSVSDGIITTMYAHTGNNAGRIGTMSNHTLEFISNGGVNAQLTTGGDFRSKGDVIAYFSFSDKILKTNIKSTENNLEKILKLNPCLLYTSPSPRGRG